VAEHWLGTIVALASSVYLAGLPTAYTLLTVGLSGHDAHRWRHAAPALFVLWVLAAVALGSVTLMRDGELMRLIRRAPPAHAITVRRRDALLGAINLILADGGSLLKSFNPKLFVVKDSEAATIELVPYLQEDVEPWEHWQAGQGAVGFAWDEDVKDPLVFVGPQLLELNKTLSPDQVAHYAQKTMIAAIVVRGEDGLRLGVLSASSVNPQPRFATARVNALKLCAARLGIFLDAL